MVSPRSKYSFLGRLNIEDIYNAFLGLEDRQQLLIVLGGIILLIFLLVVPLSCASSKLSSLDEEQSRTKEDYERFMTRIATYQTSKAELAAMKKKMPKSGPQSESLSAIIESIANDAGIGQNISSIKPVILEGNEFFDEDAIDAIISKISLDQVTDFLYKLENYRGLPLRIKKLQLKPMFRQRNEITATLQVVSIRFKGGEGE